MDVDFGVVDLAGVDFAVVDFAVGRLTGVGFFAAGTLGAGFFAAVFFAGSRCAFVSGAVSVSSTWSVRSSGEAVTYLRYQPLGLSERRNATNFR